MIIATAASFAVIGMLLWLLFTLAVFALPFYAGLWAAMWAYSHEAGLIGAAVVGVVVAGLTFGVGQVLFATIRSPWLRALVAAIYAAPAAIAGYSAVYGVSGIGGTGEAWRVAFAAIGAIVVAAVARARVSALYPGDPGRSVAGPLPATGRMLGTANDG
ncbi:hypothetical protein [Brevundimonas sp.]|jgi:hypothetical protein|uniref:hypothetical protein n=1 Tax=Brevundimonas sp. TaxID=1871086 RepID=UPI002E1426D9|nr:hypothetical protein [Brevundimonas sp.]